MQPGNRLNLLPMKRAIEVVEYGYMLELYLEFGEEGFRFNSLISGVLESATR